MKNALAQRWEHAEPKTKRMAVMGLGGVILVVILYLFVMATPSSSTRQKQRDTIVENILTGANTRELGIDGLNNRTRDLENQVTRLNNQIANLLKEIKKREATADKRRVSPGELNEKVEALRKHLEATIRATAPIPANPFQDEGERATDDDGTTGEGSDQPAPAPMPPQSSVEIWQDPAPVSMGTKTSPQPYGESGGGATPNSSQINIRVIGEKQSDGEDEGAPGEKTGVYLPAGSIITGVLITGMDAPTHNAARSEPFPALIRIKKSAILPNRYRLNVRECFIIASGYGSLSAERAYLRAETLSCVRNDGGVIEVALNAYAVGEDGKVGMRGRVVSKQGQMLAKSLAAGFFSGMSQVFGRAPVPTIQTTNSGDVSYQDVLSGDSVTAGVVEGASSALDRLSQYYLDMAKNIFPVIEINAGRKVDFIVTQGDWLRTVGN